MQTLASVLVVFATSTSAEPAQNVDVTNEVIAFVQCTTQVYESHRDSSKQFDPSAHERAWVECDSQRLAILAKAPPEQRAEWEDRLATIHRSVAQSFIPPEGVPGYGLNPKEPVMVG